MTNKKKRKNISNMIVISIVIVLIIIILMVKGSSENNTTEEIATCIGENTVLYTQLGCHACETQEEMFGENYQYLTVVDCWYDREACTQEEIKVTPTWKIKGKDYEGVQEIETLQELTNC